MRDKVISNLPEKGIKMINFKLFKKLWLFRPRQEPSARHGKLMKNERRVQPFMLTYQRIKIVKTKLRYELSVNFKNQSNICRA